MRYHAELGVNGQILKHKNYVNATHPNQIANKIATGFDTPHNSVIFVMNERGEVWMYMLTRQGRNVRATTRKSRKLLNSDEVNRVFAGILHIQDAL